MNPIAEGLEFAKRASHSGSGIGMAKLILSLYNSNHSFSFSECVSAFDRTRLDLAARMVSHYCTNGEDEALLEAGQYVHKNFPQLLELSSAASNAKSEVREQWRRAEEEKYRDEDEG